MEKDFYSWHRFKEILDRGELEEDFGLVYQPKQLWDCSVGINVGSEQNGHGSFFSRPVLVFKIFSTKIFWGIPVTTKARSGDAYFKFNLGGVNQFAILSQIRLFSVKRLKRLITLMPDEEFSQLVMDFAKLLPPSKIPLSGDSQLNRPCELTEIS
jgi:hypothetical protein